MATHTITSSSRLTSPLSSLTSPPIPETGLTTLEDFPASDLPKTVPGGYETQGASSSTESSISEVDEIEGARQSPILGAKSNAYTPTTHADQTLFAPSELLVGLVSESSSSSLESSGQEEPSPRASSSSDAGQDDESGSILRIRPFTGGTRAAAMRDETVVSTPVSSPASPSEDVIALPRIRFPADDTLRTFLFEPSYDTTVPREREQSHHRRRSSGSSSRRRDVYKYHERGVSRDFFLILSLCTGIACMVILVGRPAMMTLLGWVQADAFDDVLV